MSVEVMCRIDDGPLRPGKLEIAQQIAPLVSWSVTTQDKSRSNELGSDVAVELHLPDSTVWTGDAYLAGIETDDERSDDEFPAKVQLRGSGPLRENTVPLHADVVVARLDAMLVKDQR
ncbi:MAG TPA: hypothetical protein VFA63_09970 [Pseudonocardiaceae bacterium]|jgi:hypothetical protein|nr:hypothetical protein [Pseudonocardiaceae bacterium]